MVLLKPHKPFTINYTPNVAVGEYAYLGVTENKGEEEIITMFRTSPVTKIKQNRIETKNSIYVYRA